MLSRFRELYNKLTHSTAFKQEGSMDNSKINKDIWTPHNLKYLICGANGAVGVYFTTNNTNSHLVEWYPFTQGYKNEKEYQEMMGENKGMIDVLDSGLKFSYVEEVVLFTQGFQTEQEQYRELERINAFVCRNAKTFKRLKFIVVAEGMLTEEVLKLNPKKSFIGQLSKANVPMKATGQFTPERTELGLLLNQGLDSAEYKMDSKYDDALPQAEKGKVEYRLSRYFFEEKLMAEKAIKEKEQAAKVAEQQAKADEVEDYVTDLWTEVSKIYEELYKSAIEEGCLGILVPTGFIGYKDKKLYTNNNAWVQGLYKALVQSKAFAFKDTDKLESLSFSDLKEFNYFGKFHALNVFGIIRESERTRNWDKFLPILEKRFKTLARLYLSKVGMENITDAFGELKEKLTNCVVIERYNRQQIISLKYKLGDVKLQFNTFFEKNSKEITKVESCKILNSNVSQNNVVTLFGVFDAKKFAAEALFSYQAYDNFVKNGGRLGLDKVIVGRKLNGQNMVYSLNDNNSRVTGIFATSGAGKGVMTLGLLTAIVANNVPFIYLDFKPDMAELLWNIERDLTSKGVTKSDGTPCRVLAIDAKEDITGCSPVRGHKFGENLPSYLSTIPNTVFSVMPYLKLLQLYYLLGSIRKTTENQPDYGGKMTYAILDEFQANIKDNLSKMITTLDSECSLMKKSKDDRFKDVEKYVLKITSLVSRLASETGTFIRTDGRKSNCRAIYLGQNSDYTVWKTDTVKSVAALAGEWYSNTSYRFFGRNGGTGSYFPTNEGAITEFLNNQETFGYWTSAVGAGKVDSIKDWPVFKAYSVLNENDYNIDDPTASGRCTAGVLSNTRDDNVKKDLVENVFVSTDAEGNKIVRDEVGFLGLVRKLSGFTETQIADALSSGYDVIWRVMQKYGLANIYPDIETYLFDASLESIYTTDEIRQGVSNGKSVRAGEEKDDTPAFKDLDAIYGVSLDAEAESKQDTPPIAKPTTTPTPQHSQEPPTGQDAASPAVEDTPFDSDADVDTPPIPHVQPSSRPVRHRAESQNEPVFGGTSSGYQAPPVRQSMQNSYTGRLKVENNPFELYGSDSNNDVILSVKEMTKIIMDDIDEKIGGSQLIKDFRIAGSGVLVFNGIAYQPTFDDSFMNSLPLTLRNQVQSGELVELFNLRKIYEFKNLTSFVVEDESIAQGRVRKEMGIGFRKRYSVLFKKFGLLSYIKVGHMEYTRDNPDSDVEKSVLDAFSANPALTYAPSNSISRLDRVWDSRPVRVLTNAFGWTMGVKTVMLAATLFGPMGLLFGALAMAGAYQEIKKDIPQRQQGQINGTSQKRIGDGSSKTTRKSGKSDEN